MWLDMPIFLFCLQILTLERFQHLECLVHFVEKGCVVPFRQAISFFAESDLYMPAFPASAAQVLEWVLQNISASLENVLQRMPTKENVSTTDFEMTTADASMNAKPSYSRSQTFVEGISKTSVAKRACDIQGHSLKVRTT